MSIHGRESLSSSLFHRTDDVEVLDIRFLKGSDPALTADEMCETAREVLDRFWAGRGPTNTLPVGRRPQREVAEIIAGY